MESTSSSTLSSSSLDDLGTIDFFQHPDARSVSCFFLGCLFLAGIRQFTRSITSIIFSHSIDQRSYHTDVEIAYGSGFDKPSPHSPPEERSPSTGWKVVDKRTILLLGMSFCFAVASVLEMVSLLSFAANGGAARCGGLVITAGIMEHLAALSAFMYASIEVRMLGTATWEQRGFFLLLLAAFGLQCAEAALTTFAVNEIPTLDFGFCWRNRPTTICAANAVVVILCGIYVSARLYAAIVPEPAFTWRSQLATFGDARVARGISLLLHGLLAFLPSIASFGIAGDIIPLAISGVVLLQLFRGRASISAESTPGQPSPNEIRVELFPEPISPEARSDESHGVATSPKPLSLSSIQLMELNGSRIAVNSVSDDGRMPSPAQSSRPSRSPGPIVPKLTQVMNVVYPPSPRAPSVSQESVIEILTARRIKRPGTGNTAGKSIRSARPVSFLTNQNPYADRGFVRPGTATTTGKSIRSLRRGSYFTERGMAPPSPGSAARTEFEFTTTEDDDGLTRSGTVSTNLHSVSRNTSSTASHLHSDISRPTPSASGRWKNTIPVALDGHAKPERSISRRTFGGESHTLSRAASKRRSIPPSPVAELPPLHSRVPLVNSSKQLPAPPSL